MIQLNNDLFLGIERYNNKTRLVIYKGADELVCRKSTFAELEQLFENEEIHLFKGRLQLYRAGKEIAVEVKGKNEGFIHLDKFSKYYQGFKTSVN